MSDTPVPSPPTPALLPAAATVAIGFLAVAQDAGGVLGGYLVTNAWGRPLEFRLTTAVQPNKVQQILYGPTLTEYLHADLIGKTLIEKTAVAPTLVVTDGLPALGLRSRLPYPVVALKPKDAADLGGAIEFTNPRCSVPLLLPAGFAADTDAVLDRLERVDPAVDLAEPFARIREAIAEARKMGVTGRAA